MTKRETTKILFEVVAALYPRRGMPLYADAALWLQNVSLKLWPKRATMPLNGETLRQCADMLHAMADQLDEHIAATATIGFDPRVAPPQD